MHILQKIICFDFHMKSECTMWIWRLRPLPIHFLLGDHQIQVTWPGQVVLPQGNVRVLCSSPHDNEALLCISGKFPLNIAAPFMWGGLVMVYKNVPSYSWDELKTPSGEATLVVSEHNSQLSASMLRVWQSSVREYRREPVVKPCWKHLYATTHTPLLLFLLLLYN
jgi:hypothetical protein